MRACVSVCVWKNTEKTKEQPEQCAVFVFCEKSQKKEQCADVLCIVCIVGIVCSVWLCIVYIVCCICVVLCYVRSKKLGKGTNMDKITG